MKAIGYIRVSTEEQAKHGISLNMQRAEINAYAQLESMTLVEIVADEGLSGCTIKTRPGIQKILQMVRRREVEAVVVFKLDRLARNTIEALKIARLMDRKAVALHSITERLDTKSAMGRFFFTLMASLAEMERGIISERIKAAMDRKRERGEPRNGNPPYGFRIVAGQVIADSYEQKVIQRIVALHGAGHTIFRIIDILRREDLLNRRGKPFGKTQIHNLILRNVA
jgi:site-specific DNA recombinase